MLDVTPTASQAVKSIMTERKLSSPLRVFLTSGG
jgi:Fe-S cluster assembly iron-binding protein IscA